MRGWKKWIMVFGVWGILIGIYGQGVEAVEKKEDAFVYVAIGDEAKMGALSGRTFGISYVELIEEIIKNKHKDVHVSKQLAGQQLTSEELVETISSDSGSWLKDADVITISVGRQELLEEVVIDRKGNVRVKEPSMTKILSMRENISKLFRIVNEQNKEGEVYVVGYTPLFQHVSIERHEMNQLLLDANRMLQSITQEAGFHFVPLVQDKNQSSNRQWMNTYETRPSQEWHNDIARSFTKRINQTQPYSYDVVQADTLIQQKVHHHLQVIDTNQNHTMVTYQEAVQVLTPFLADLQEERQLEEPSSGKRDLQELSHLSLLKQSAQVPLDQPISRERFTVMLAQIFDIHPTAERAFSDVQEDHRSSHLINGLADVGIVYGYEDGTFKGDRPLAKRELMNLLARTYEVYYEKITNSTAPR